MAEESKKPEAVSAEEEIKELENKLEEKKRELAEKQETLPEEKELFRELLRQHIEQERPILSTKPSSPPAPPVSTVPTPADDLKNKEEREAQIRALIEFALTKSLNGAIKMAGETSPYLLDELHDHLIDDYYDKLVTLRKLKKL